MIIKKLTFVETLNKSIKKIEADRLLQDFANDLRSVSDDIKHFNVLTKKRLVKDSHDVNKIEEARVRNAKHDDKENMDIAHMLRNMNKTLLSEKENSMRFDLSAVAARAKLCKQCDIPSFLDVPKPKNGSARDPARAWEIFHNTETTLGTTMHKKNKSLLVQKLTSKENNDQLSPINDEISCELIDLTPHRAPIKWNSKG